jgi:hypothetical protein
VRPCVIGECDMKTTQRVRLVRAKALLYPDPALGRRADSHQRPDLVHRVAPYLACERHARSFLLKITCFIQIGSVLGYWIQINDKQRNGKNDGNQRIKKIKKEVLKICHHEWKYLKVILSPSFHLSSQTSQIKKWTLSQIKNRGSLSHSITSKCVAELAPYSSSSLAIMF